MNDKPEEKSSLEESQSKWENETESFKQSVFEEYNVSDDGTMGSIERSTSMLNYYKGRAAVLYEQIYKITGSFEL